MRRLIAPAAVLAFALSAVAADSWPQFRGPTGDGHSAAKNLPTEWSETQNVRWKTAIHDKGWSSPVVWGEQVWLTTAKEDGSEMFAVCVDRTTGKVVHDVKLFTHKNLPDMRAFNSYASPTPAIEEGRVYAHFGTYGTACVDTATAKVLWTAPDLPCDHYRGPAASPVLWEDKLILSFDGFDKQFEVALDKATGKIAWKKDRHIKYKTDNGDMKKAFATPTVFDVGGKPQLVCPAAEQTTALDPATGDELWRVTHGGMNEACRPVRTADGLILLSSGHTNNLLAVKPGSGDLGKDAVAWTFEKQAPSKPSATVVGDHVYVVNDKGVAFCLDAKTGKAAWDVRLESSFSASPLYADGRLYLCGENGKTFVLDASPNLGKEAVVTNRLDAGCRASPAAVGDALYVRTLTHLYCIGKK